jgi:hypothetical protein
MKGRERFKLRRKVEYITKAADFKLEATAAFQNSDRSNESLIRLCKTAIEFFATSCSLVAGEGAKFDRSYLNIPEYAPILYTYFVLQKLQHPWFYPTDVLPVVMSTFVRNCIVLDPEQTVADWIAADDAQVRQDVAVAIYPRGNGADMSEGAVVEGMAPESHRCCRPIEIKKTEKTELKGLALKDPITGMASNGMQLFVRRLCIRRLKAGGDGDEKPEGTFGVLELLTQEDIEAIAQGERDAAKRMARARMFERLPA